MIKTVIFVLYFLCGTECSGQQMPDGFAIEPIHDELFERIKGKSFKKDCTTSRDSLRYIRLLHYDFNGIVRNGEMICNHRIANDIVEIFHQLYKARYPIERVVLVDDFNADDEASMAANNTSCFNFRYVAGTRIVSRHGLGLAVDINPKYNPHVKSASQAAPSQYRIDHNDLCYKLFIQHGFKWGGDWKHSKDYQHFEK
ncbi:MAG: M15 family metallopeptidase [Bacteroidaceae bacterium]|nr:M15 family metallopeptidase [Bacteroidaceae bacterium]